MSLTTGTKLGNFEIAGLLGVGGMGEVYRARDTKLGREVAIKVLPADFAQDAERLARFEREARLLASLDHPNIGALHDFQHVDGVRFLVLQLVEGQTLADRIAKGALPVEEALPLFVQIAQGLALAHERGIVHRDLKPDNVRITPDGLVKVLDFGIAKSAVARPQTIAPDAPTTLVSPMAVTAEGAFIGTPTYMAPEQARAKDVDKRADVWAFGCCLFETLTGRPPFTGETVTDVVAAIVERQPDWTTLPKLPAQVESLLRRCLEKDPNRRLSSLGDIAITLEETADSLRKSSASIARPESRESQTSPSRDRAIEKIAVLPFDNLMGDPEQEYFVDGMTETLVAQLAKIKGMRVLSRTSAMHYKKTDKSIPTIARELGVDALVEGSILRAGNDLRITTRLVHGWTDEHLWADSYDGKLENILSLQSKVALDIAKEIQIAVSPDDAQRMLKQRAVDPAIHEAVLQGRFYWNKRTKKGFEQAVEHFQRAIELDPDYAPAHAGLADAYLLQGYYGLMRPLEIMPLAKMEAERAVELDPASAHGFASLGRIAMDFEWDWAKVEELYLRAIELDPDYPTAHYWYSDFLRLVAGRLDEAFAEASLAHQLDPLAPQISNILAAAYEFRRDFGKAIGQNQYTLDMHPNFTNSLMGILRCHLYAGDYDSARPHLERLRATRSGSTLALMIDARFLAAAGKKEEATRIAVEALQKFPTTAFMARMYLAVAFWEVGDDNKAFELLSEAVKERGPVLHLPANPWFDSMRGDPRFQAFLGQMNLPPLPPDHPVAILNRQRKEDTAPKPEK